MHQFPFCLKVDPRRFPKFHRSHEAFALLHGNAPFSTLSFNSQAVSALCALLFLRMILLLGLGIDRNCSSSASNSCIVLRSCMSFRLDARIRIRGFFDTCVLPYISSASAPSTLHEHSFRFLPPYCSGLPPFGFSP